MNVVLSPSMDRGDTLIKFAYSNQGATLDLSIPDYVGLVASYMNHGRLPIDIENELSERLGPTIGAKARQVFETFDHYHGRFLWCQGPATDDIRLTNRKLSQRFPRVNAANDRSMARG